MASEEMKGGDQSGSTGFAIPTGTTPLRSLAPKYEEEHHEHYLERLRAAVADEKNKNIALMGRYGTGKSSILDAFEQDHARKHKVLRISINTLGPSGSETDITNRIQKELVRHLTYRAAPGQLRNSRFARIKPFSWPRAIRQSAGATAVLGLVLFLLGWLPAVTGTGESKDPRVQALAWVGIALATFVIVLFVRWVLDGRVVSDVSAAGTAVKISERSETYFDEYLEEIAYFFDVVKPEVVIFEDLDRFGDPYIFDSLRELNTLLNASPTRENGKPIRFIYAIRDSLFAQLGREGRSGSFDGVAVTSPEGHEHDFPAAPVQAQPAAIETERANRTKFFELIIPVVPFISHRNARELMVNELTRLGWDVSSDSGAIDRRLIDTVARYTTDMRLLVNICNEFTVFAEHLLGSKRAPGLEPTGLFAVVAYKNFHLEDFELISRRESALDKLETDHARLVRESIARAETERRGLLRSGHRDSSKHRLARTLGERLNRIADAVKDSGQYATWNHQGYKVDEQKFERIDAEEPAFWAAAAGAHRVAITAGSSNSHQRELHQIGSSGWSTLFPEAHDAKRWDDLDQEEHSEKLRALDRTVAFLQGADFADLARRDEFTLGETADGEGGKTLRVLVNDRLSTDLGRDLVKQGFIDRNFALYAAQFYGDFAGVDVAQFLVQSVQRNQMKPDHQFSGPAAIENLLAEAPPTFTRSISVLNLQVFDYLLAEMSEHAREAISFLVSGIDGEARAFLEAYFNTGRERLALAAGLAAQGWPGVLEYLATSDEVPDDGERALLVSEALLALPDAGEFRAGTDVADYIARNLAEMPAFTEPQTPARSAVVYEVAKRADLILDSLRLLGVPLRELVVAGHRYRLTADNLRSAVARDRNPDQVQLKLETLREQQAVWDFCASQPADLLEALRTEDGATPPLTVDPTVLAETLSDLTEWSDEEIEELARLTDPDLEITLSEGVPPERWPVLARTGRLDMGVSNLKTYIDHCGVDKALGGLLAERIETVPETTHSVIDVAEDDDPAATTAVAVSILNSPAAIPDAAVRAKLVERLGLPKVPLDQLQPQEGDLLRELLSRRLVEEDAETFKHFLDGAGWESVESAAAWSQRFVGFLSPDLLGTAGTDLLRSRGTPFEVRAHVLQRLDEFVPNDDLATLKAAATAAVEHKTWPPAEAVQRVARVVAAEDLGLVLGLLSSMSVADLPNEALVQTLALLPPPWSHLATRAEEQFELPTDDAGGRMVNKLVARRLVAIERHMLKKDIVRIL